MASQAEVDLIVNASRTLPELERDLNRVITAAQRGADDIDVQATINTTATVSSLINDLDRVAAAAAAGADDIDMQAVLNQRNTLVGLRRDLNNVVNAARRGDVDQIALTGVLNTRATLTNVRTQLDDVVRRAQAAAPDVEINVDVDRDRIVRTIGRLTSSLGSLAGGFAAVTAAAGPLAAALPVVASGLANIVPAAAVATQGMLSMALVSGTLKLGLMGVEDALTTAFDPEAKPEDLAKAMEKLAPEAQKFVKALRGLKDEFKDLQLDVQGRLFDGLGKSVGQLSKTVLPDVGGALKRTADSLNDMALGAVDAANKLGKSGVLDTALRGATTGLQNLEKVPGRVVTGFGQIAAAAAPAFDRVTKAVDRVSLSIANRLTAAFESGALDRAINEALDLIKQLGAVGGNILGGLRNVFQGLTTDGRGLFDILENITQGFQDATAGKEFQNFLNELALTGDSLVKNVLPLLLTAIETLAPALAELGPPTRDFIEQIGPQLKPLIEELGPILLDLAQIFKDQMPTAIAFVSAAIKDLTIILQGIHFVLQNLVIPILKGVADLLNSEFVTSVAGASETLAGFAGDAVKSFDTFRSGLSNAVTTVVTRFGELKESVGRSIATTATNGIAAAQRFAAGLVARAIEAKDGFVRAIARMGSDVIARVAALPGRIRGALGNLSGLLFSAGASIVQGLIDGIRSKVSSLISALGDITNRIPDWKGPAEVDAKILFESGRLVMQGFQDGLASQVGSLRGQLGGLTAAMPGFTGAGSLSAPSVSNQFRPNVFVSIGNEPIRAIVRTEADALNRWDIRTAAQGVRR